MAQTISTINDLLVGCWRRYALNPDSEKGITAFKQGLTLSRKIADELTLKSATLDDCLITTNMAWFSPINKKHMGGKLISKIGLTIGIFVWTNLNPEAVKAGKQGAGSEYAVNELAEALTRRGYNVYVFTNINTDENWKYCLSGRNPQYIPLKKDAGRDYIGPSSAGFITCFSDLLLRQPGNFCLDHLIVWRMYEMLPQHYNMNNYAPKVHFWSHDFSHHHFDYKVSTIYTLSEYHKQKMMEIHGYNMDYIVGCNGTGVDISLPIVRRQKKTVCYASNYARGLEVLLDFWREVWNTINDPQIELHIFYGRETWGCLNRQQLDQIVNKIERLKDCNVFERCKDAMIPHNQLLEEFKQMSILCYPYTGESETHSIVCVAAQQQGCITCVRKRHGLLDTCMAQNDLLLEDTEIKVNLIQLLRKNEDELTPLRQIHRDTTKHFSWDLAAEKWSIALK